MLKLKREVWPARRAAIDPLQSWAFVVSMTLFAMVPVLYVVEMLWGGS